MANKHKISIFDLFVASKDNRPNLAKPFRVWDWIGATNSFIAMRVPASLVDTDLQENESRIEAEKFNGFFWEFWEWQEVDVKKWDTLLQTLRTVQEFKPRETCPALWLRMNGWMWPLLKWVRLQALPLRMRSLTTYPYWTYDVSVLEYLRRPLHWRQGVSISNTYAGLSRYSGSYETVHQC